MTKAATETHRIAAIEATRALEQVLLDAGPTLRAAAHDARVFSVPMQTLDTDTPPTAPILDLSGSDAIQSGLDALLALEYDDEQHPMATRRCPGVIAFNDDLGELVRHVNEHKQALRAAMSTMGTAKWQYWRDRIPAWKRLNRLQAYREWHWLTEPVRQAGFSWVGYDHSIEQLRIATMMGRLSRQQRTNDHPHIREELDVLAGYDENEVIMLRRPIAPSPMANVAHVSGKRRPIKTALPLLVCGALPEKIGPLRDFDPSAHIKRNRSDAIIGERILEHWAAFRYRKPHRFTLPAPPKPTHLLIRDGHLIARPQDDTPVDLGVLDGPRLIGALEATRGLRGPVDTRPPLDRAESARLVAVNIAHIYVVHERTAVWRVARGDLSDVAGANR